LGKKENLRKKVLDCWRKRKGGWNCRWMAIRWGKTDNV